MAHLPPTFDARLARARALTPGVRELVFERLDGQPMSFTPGQWVSTVFAAAAGLDAPSVDAAAGSNAPSVDIAGADASVVAVGAGDPEMKRSYSIASSPDGSPRFEIAVTHVQGGPGSTRLHAMSPGSVMRFVGPQGFFTRSGTAFESPALMIATGTGVTPMRSMLRAAAAHGSPSTIWLLLGVRHEEDILYEDEFRALAREHAFFRFEPTLSRPRGLWDGRRGYVQTHVRELWNELAARGEPPPHAYVCGLERMVGSVREMLRKEMGLPRQQVHSERYD
jgi:CDP-4-dehydro-6-deoxyglucose reductase